MAIVRLCCEQLTGVAILGTGDSGASREYVVHAQQFVGLLKGNMDKRFCSKAFNAFIESEAGCRLKGDTGGDLVSALQNGSLEKMMYTHRLNPQGGLPSMFLTVKGIKEVMRCLPHVEEAEKSRLKDVFAHYLDQPGCRPLTFLPATPEQCAKDDADEVIGEAFTEGCARSTVGNASIVVSHQTWFDMNMFEVKFAADKRVLEARLEAKDSVIASKDSVMAANDSLKAAEIAKERAEKEMAQKELVHVKEAAEKDARIAQLQMKLELTEEKARLRAEFMASRVERNEERDKVQRTTTGVKKKIHARDTMFAKQISDFWDNDDADVNSFVKLSDRGVPSSGNINNMPELVVKLFAGGQAVVGTKQRVFGFCFRGPAITETSLKKTDLIKEAYGVEEDGVQYVCIVLYKSVSQPLSAFPTLPYTLQLLPCTLVADTVAGRDYQLAVYRTGVSSDDPVLRMLKRPSSEKWLWHSSVRRDV
jgi:hypothetical protein